MSKWDIFASSDIKRYPLAWSPRSLTGESVKIPHVCAPLPFIIIIIIISSYVFI